MYVCWIAGFSLPAGHVNSIFPCYFNGLLFWKVIFPTLKWNGKVILTLRADTKNQYPASKHAVPSLVSLDVLLYNFGMTSNTYLKLLLAFEIFNKQKLWNLGRLPMKFGVISRYNFFSIGIVIFDNFYVKFRVHENSVGRTKKNKSHDSREML